MAAAHGAPSGPKRHCVSTACIACRRRKSKCDGNLPSCAMCSSVYHTPCIYDPNTDHRRKVYKKDLKTLQTEHTTLRTLVQALSNYEENDAIDLMRRIRSCDDLEDVALSVVAHQKSILSAASTAGRQASDESPAPADQFGTELSEKMSELMLDGSRKFIGGTSNLIFLPPGAELHESASIADAHDLSSFDDMHRVRRWTQVTEDSSLIDHLITMYFTWHYPFFTILAKDLFYRDYTRGIPSAYCSPLLVNSMLAVGCHFTSRQGAFAEPTNAATAGDHFFKEAKRLFLENDEHGSARLCTVQAFALMSVHEAGCGREGMGWVYSGLSFRMAFDIGLNVDAANLDAHNLSDEEMDARRITFWGCYLIDKCWSNYLGRQPQLSSFNTNVPKFDVLPKEEAETWSAYTDAGAGHEHAQPSRTRAVALQVSRLCEINNDLLVFFYHPSELEKSQAKQSELKKLSDVHGRLEAWAKELPEEFQPKEGHLPQVLILHMFNQLLLIHLYRPFLKYTNTKTPLPSHVSPRKMCTQAASAISKLLRMYKRTYGLKQICNIVVYIAHTACTIHLLNLPEKNAQRDVIHGLNNLEEMAEGWLCARRTLRILDISATKWQVKLPTEASALFERTHTKWGSWGAWDQVTSSSTFGASAITHAKLHSTVTSPRRFSPSANPIPLAEGTEPVQPNPSSVMDVSMGVQYPSTAIMAAFMPQMHAARLQQGPRPEFASPQPTYLRPMSQVYQVPAIAAYGPSVHSSPNAWYGTSCASAASQNTAPGSTAPPGGFDDMDDLVGQSQDWWSRKAAALGLGMENWGGLWSPDIPNPHFQYENNHSHFM